MTGINWQERINPVVRDLPPSGIRRFFDLVSEMKGIISLGVGEPDFVTPWHIREACVYSLEKGYTMYTSNQGLLELREEIARDLDHTYGVTYDARGELLVTVGVSEGLDLAMRALVCPGDEVIFPEPSYVSYAPSVALAGGVPVPVATSVEEDFRLTAESIERAITPRTRILLICYPNNPTGAVLRRRDVLEIAEVVDPALQKNRDQVFFGATVTYADQDDRERTVRIVGIDEADTARGEVSWISPIARALLKAREGDVVEIRTPAGPQSVEVVAIDYETV